MASIRFGTDLDVGGNQVLDAVAEVLTTPPNTENDDRAKAGRLVSYQSVLYIGDGTRFKPVGDSAPVEALEQRVTTIEGAYATKGNPTAGTYNKVTINAEGIVTAGENAGVTIADVEGLQAEIDGLKAEDTTLDGKITAEETARMQRDNQLGVQIETVGGESETRDTQLGDRITAIEGDYLKTADLDDYYDKTEVDGLIQAEATARETRDGELAGQITTVDTDSKSRDNALDGRITAIQTEIDGLGTASTKDAGAEAGNVPILDGNGKLPNSTIPPMAIGEVVPFADGTAHTKANLVTLTGAEQGDIAIVDEDTDSSNNGVYFLNGTYSTLTDWIQITSPSTGFGVATVNGRTGAVVLDKTDVGLGNVDNTSDLNKPVSTATQTAIDGVQTTLQGLITAEETARQSADTTLDGKITAETTARTQADTTLDAKIDTKQDILVSGTNIKTINGETLLGTGDVTVEQNIKKWVKSGDTFEYGTTSIDAGQFADDSNRDFMTGVIPVVWDTDNMAMFYPYHIGSDYGRYVCVEDGRYGIMVVEPTSAVATMEWHNLQDELTAGAGLNIVTDSSGTTINVDSAYDGFTTYYKKSEVDTALATKQDKMTGTGATDTPVYIGADGTPAVVTGIKYTLLPMGETDITIADAGEVQIAHGLGRVPKFVQTYDYDTNEIVYCTVRVDATNIYIQVTANGAHLRVTWMG